MTKTTDYPVMHVQINTCSQLYNNWRKVKKFYHEAPTTGLDLSVEYADNKYQLASENQLNDERQENSEEIRPVVLALHGAPGSHEDFAPIIKHLTQQGVRIIAPNFPDYYLTVRSKFWRHSAEEKAEYIKDFLRAINVKKIDMLLSHSSAIYPSLILRSTQPEFQIHSIAFFNPGGHRRVKAMRPAWFIEGGIKVYQHKFGRAVFNKFGSKFLDMTNAVRVQTDKMQNVILSGTTMTYSGFKNLDKKLKELKASGIPLLFVFSENDKLIEKEVFYEMSELLGAKEENIDVFDEEGKQLKSATEKDSKIQVVIFHAGGHYAFLKYVDQINNSCSQLLIRSLNQQKSQNNNNSIVPSAC